MPLRPARLIPGVLVLLSACAAVGPDPYAQPDIAVPARFAESSGAAQPAQPDAQFWTAYRDRMLDEVVARGLTQSLDILSATESIAAAQADLRGQGVLGSQVSGSATGSSIRSTGGLTTRQGSLSAAFVLDLFGGALRARQASAAALDAAEFEAQTVRTAWLAEVISAYGTARYMQQAIEVTRQTIVTRERTVAITRDKVEIGTASGMELIQAQAQLDTARADLPSYQAQFNAQVYHLATLLNEPAGPLLDRMQRGAPPLRIPATPAGGVPADLLRNRPDVRAAEQALVAALATVGVATADMLPSITLGGTISDGTGGASWTFGPQISLPILNQTALGAVRERRQAEARQAEVAWRAAVAAAVEDVQTAQSNLRRARQRLVALEAAASAQDEAFGMAQDSFESGAITLLDLLDLDRERVSARFSVLTARNDAAQEWAALQIAIGSGVSAAANP